MKLLRPSARIVQCDCAVLQDAIRRISAQFGLVLKEQQWTEGALQLLFASEQEPLAAALRPLPSLFQWKCRRISALDWKVEAWFPPRRGRFAASVACQVLLGLGIVAGLRGVAQAVPEDPAVYLPGLHRFCLFLGATIGSMLAFTLFGLRLHTRDQRGAHVIEAVFSALRNELAHRETTILRHPDSPDGMCSVLVTYALFAAMVLAANLSASDPLTWVAWAFVGIVALLATFMLADVKRSATIVLATPVFVGVLLLAAYVSIPLELDAVSEALGSPLPARNLRVGLAAAFPGCMLFLFALMAIFCASYLPEALSLARVLSSARSHEEAWAVFGSKRGQTGIAVVLLAVWAFVFVASWLVLLWSLAMLVSLVTDPLSSPLVQLLRHAPPDTILARLLVALGVLVSHVYAAAPLLVFGYFAYRRIRDRRDLLGQCRAGEVFAQEVQSLWSLALADAAATAETDLPRVSLIHSPVVDSRAVSLGPTVSGSYIMLTDAALSALEPNELRALIAHELWHLARHGRMLRILNGLSNITLFGRDLLCHIQNPFKMELQADDFAARSFGSAAILGVLHKAKVTGAMYEAMQRVDMGFHRKQPNSAEVGGWPRLPVRRRMLIGLRIFGDVVFGSGSLWYVHPSIDERIRILENEMAEEHPPARKDMLAGESPAGGATNENGPRR